MTEQQTPKLAAALVEHQGAFTSMSTDDAQWVIMHTVDAISVFVEAVKNRVKNTLLKLLGKVEVQATKRFIARDNFTLGNAGISYLGDNFKERFLGKTEENVLKTTLFYHELTKSSVDRPIINELGGEAKAETRLSQLYVLLKKQSSGQKDAFLTNGFANIFYVCDINGVLWAVFAHWDGDGWLVSANSVENPRGWDEGDRVFSGNS